MRLVYFLAEHSDCYALLTSEEIKPKDFMADQNGIYEAPEIDGFIGFSKVVACTISKGDLPLIDAKQILIPLLAKNEKIWKTEVKIDESNNLKVTNGFIEILGIHTPLEKFLYVR